MPGLTPGAAIRHGVAWVPPDRLAQGLIASLPTQENLPMLVLRRFFSRGMIHWSAGQAAYARSCDGP